MRVFNKDGKFIGEKKITITRDLMFFVSETGNDEIEICLVKPITERRAK